MRKVRNPLFFVSLAVCISCIALSRLLPAQVSNSQRQEEIDVNHFPIVDSTLPVPTDPTERAKRQRKNQRYNNRYAPPITENTEKMFTVTDWEFGLPAFPVGKSAAVVIGDITRADAYLSGDKSSVYSEFSVRISEVLKNDSHSSLASGAVVAVDRTGGRVHFPSGKTVASLVDRQDMPRVGGRYLLFLIHRFPADETEDLYILTGYEFRAGHVFPLDKLSPKHPISKYEGTSVASFLADLNAAVANPH